ncbi:MAG TPA: hypothetical protein VI636_12390 [Candidatus Angelobacter sp.]
MRQIMLKSKLLIAALITFGFMCGTVTVRADDHDRDDKKCEKRVHKAEEQLEKAIRKHGEHSEQAERKRHDLEETRERCHDRDHDHDHN